MMLLARSGLLFLSVCLLTLPCFAQAPGAAAPPAAKPVEPELAPTFADVAYGPQMRNVLDFWQAKGDGPRPLLVMIHGGGWVAGQKDRKAVAIQPWLDKGISVAGINYRLTGTDPLPAPVHDAARTVQFLKSKASEWNIRKDRIALTGGSAGACSSMWILLHDDLADPNATDPVLRESTRVSGAAVGAGQTSIDPKVIEGWLGPNVLKHRMIWMAVGEPTMDAALANYDKHHATYVEFSPVNHVTSDDPPLLMTYAADMTLPSKDAGHGIHHGMYGVKLKEKSDACGHECHLLIPGYSKSDKYTSSTEFLTGILLAP
ncbi:alpha/beta hydrolase [Planctomicrobium piriforme]|uniref:Alpha/beta hydrolase fold n=1 Tax=Planctomicrobium piriforme TaxID=1576369 RepID=A0A1I3KXP2_9PLAN|nr:alpha/beta hydrolase [Planctomicrobium piriforme]SFI77196.1 alpha/beta hydrolase fold [Planctomicrobium piriforme]